MGRDLPECPLTWLMLGSASSPPSWDSPVSEETAQYSACISWATLRASFSIRLYCAGVCQASQAWVGDRDSQGTACPQGGGHTHAQILLGAHQEEDHVGWVILLQGISQPLPVGATVSSCWLSTALVLSLHSSPTNPPCPALKPPTLIPGPPPGPCVTYRVCSRDPTSLTSKTITMAGEGKRGETGTGTVGWAAGMQWGAHPVLPGSRWRRCT